MLPYYIFNHLITLHRVQPNKEKLQRIQFPTIQIPIKIIPKHIILEVQEEIFIISL